MAEKQSNASKLLKLLKLKPTPSFVLNNAALNVVADYAALAKQYGKPLAEEEVANLSKSTPEVVVTRCIESIPPTTLAFVWNTINRHNGNAIDVTESIKKMRSNAGKKELVKAAVTLLKG